MNKNEIEIGKSYVIGGTAYNRAVYEATAVGPAAGRRGGRWNVTIKDPDKDFATYDDVVTSRDLTARWDEPLTKTRYEKRLDENGLLVDWDRVEYTTTYAEEQAERIAKVKRFNRVVQGLRAFGLDRDYNTYQRGAGERMELPLDFLEQLLARVGPTGIGKDAG